MNDFCKECTGSDYHEVCSCKDRKCPYYRDRFQNMEWQDARKGDKLDLSRLIASQKKDMRYGNRYLVK